MLLTLTAPTPDLTYLLHKHPARVHTVSLSMGEAHVFYPSVTETRCTAALLLEIDPVALARGHAGTPDNAPLEPYVNDRPYVASSFLSVAIARAFGTALAGRCRDKPELVSQRFAFEVRLPVLPCRGGEALLRQLFEPLGYALEISRLPLDERFPAWGESPYYDVVLRAEHTLADMLAHVYVLVPVLDDAKHYWVGDDELGKLLRHGDTWLATHPARELIARRYLKHQPDLTREALARLVPEEQETPEASTSRDADEAAVERRVGLAEQRTHAVIEALRAAAAHSVIDLGCGEGRLLRALSGDKHFTRIAGMDISSRSLARAADRLHFDRLAPTQRARFTLLHGSLTYRDARFAGFDAAALIEVIEHLDVSRLGAFERTVFEFAKPRTVIVTTPNVEYNVHFAQLPAGRMRHADHRFEWTRAEFATWCSGVCERHGYTVRYVPVGPEDEVTGAPTQMAVFTLASTIADAVAEARS